MKRLLPLTFIALTTLSIQAYYCPPDFIDHQAILTHDCPGQNSLTFDGKL